MGIEFNTEDMLDTYLFENGQLLENLQSEHMKEKQKNGLLLVQQKFLMTLEMIKF